MRKRRSRKRRRPTRRFFLIFALLTVAISGILSILNGKDKPRISIPVYVENSGHSKEVKGTCTVVIDPGHGGDDSGAVSINGEMEKDINLSVALRLGKLLEKSGIKVIYTRTQDELLDPTSQKSDLQARCDISNDAGADIFVSIHCNFDTVSVNTRGIETWCRFPGKNGDKLAKAIQKELVSLGYSKDRGIKYEADGGLYVLKNTDAVAVLVELGFLSNEQDAEFLTSEDGQEQMAKAIAQGILSYKNSK